MKKEKDPVEDIQEDNFYSLFNKIVKHNPDKKKKPEKKKPNSKNPQSS